MALGKIDICIYCTECGDRETDADLAGVGISLGAACRVLDCYGTYQERTKLWYVNVYELDQVCGGSEEGGWWFRTGEPVYSETTFTNAFAWFRAEKLAEGEYASTGRPLHSVNYSGGTYDVRVQKHPAKAFPEVTPHYS